MALKIAVLGHSSDSFSDNKAILQDIDNAIAVIKRQYSLEDYLFISNGEPGVGQWACNVWMENSTPYELYLTTSPDESAKYWTEEQQHTLLWQCSKASSIHIFYNNNSYENRIKRNQKIIDDCNWLLIFWDNKHQGITYDSLKYAISNNKIVYNGINGMKLLDKTIEMKKEEGRHEEIR